MGCPIRISPDQSLFASSPRLFAGYYVLHRLLPPRHPPYALRCLTLYPQVFCNTESWAARCTVLADCRLPSLHHRFVKELSAISSAQRGPFWLRSALITFEPLKSAAFWWSQSGSNRRPPACKAGALPTELWPPRDSRFEALGSRL